jgi:predicted dehydrogenase
LRIGIVGLGIMGRRLLGAILRHPRAVPGPAWDPSQAACAEARSIDPDLEIAADAQAVAAGCDLVYLACPPGPRKDLALASAAAGKPIFLEKPLGTDVEASRDLVQRLGAAGVPAAVNFTQAACPALLDIQRAQAEGELGAVAGIDILVQYAAWPRAWQADADWLRYADEGGFTREVISHFVFLSARLLGPLEVVFAHPHFPQPGLAETALLARLEAADGTPVSILGTVGGARPDRQEVTVRGERRSLRVVDFYGLDVSEGGAFAPARHVAAGFDGDARHEALAAQLDEAVKLARGEDHRLATVAEAFSVQQRIETMLRGTG